MTAKWASTLRRWPPHEVSGQTYDLSHVHPIRYTLLLSAHRNLPAQEVEIRVGFSAHTFTTGCLIAQDPDTQYSTGPRDLRKFCPDRYELSKRLPEIVRNLDGRKCFFTDRDNYFVVEMPDAVPAGFEYWVFFDVRSVGEPGAVLLFVQSAYAGDSTKSPRGRKGEKVGFKVLVNKALQNRRATRPT